MKRKTQHDGVNRERSAWLAYLRRLRKHGKLIHPDDLIAWGLERNERYKAKRGGL